MLSDRHVGARLDAAAQSQGAIIGVVTDTSGAVLPGVTVVATGPALQVPQIEAVTNERGEYRLSPLPPGVFTVTFRAAGFQTVKRENLRLALGFTATLDQAMGLGRVCRRRSRCPGSRRLST